MRKLVIKARFFLSKKLLLILKEETDRLVENCSRKLPGIIVFNMSKVSKKIMDKMVTLGQQRKSLRLNYLQAMSALSQDKVVSAFLSAVLMTY